MAPVVGVLNYNVACIRCGAFFPIHIATEDLYRTGKVIACCTRCLIASKIAFDDWQNSRRYAGDDADLEMIDDNYSAEVTRIRLKNVPKYSEVK